MFKGHIIKDKEKYPVFSLKVLASTEPHLLLSNKLEIQLEASLSFECLTSELDLYLLYLQCPNPAGLSCTNLT